MATSVVFGAGAQHQRAGQRRQPQTHRALGKSHSSIPPRRRCHRSGVRETAAGGGQRPSASCGEAEERWKVVSRHQWQQQGASQLQELGRVDDAWG